MYGGLFAGSDPLDTSFRWDSEQDRENWEQIPKILQWTIYARYQAEETQSPSVPQ